MYIQIKEVFKKFDFLKVVNLVQMKLLIINT